VYLPSVSPEDGIIASNKLHVYPLLVITVITKKIHIIENKLYLFKHFKRDREHLCFLNQKIPLALFMRRKKGSIKTWAKTI
jgi:hypothetical protein